MTQRISYLDTGALLLSSLLALSACSKLADKDTSAPALATITGSLTVAEGAVLPDDVMRVALLWSTAAAAEPVNAADYAEGCGPWGWYEKLEQQQVEIEPSFPSDFVLNLTAPPPPEALQPFALDENISNAVAVIVVYADGNDNGRLDGRTETGPSPDRVLATSHMDPWGVLEEGDIYSSRVLYNSASYYLETENGPYDFEAGYYLGTSIYPFGSETVSVDTPIDLHLTGAPVLQEILCPELCREYVDIAECPASLTDLESAPAGSLEIGDTFWTWAEGADGYATLSISCGDDLDSPGYFYWSRTRCEGCNCQFERCSYAQADVPAADWPCE